MAAVSAISCSALSVVTAAIKGGAKLSLMAVAAATKHTADAAEVEAVMG